ncbi:hypothetical protein [Anaeroselena agilis]|uniref:Uncharacterized protein n=1 Tax=Anaeroselena agilis TaxID=3063788 RepID=A0ABU3NYG5_9FIRM|nr:hypothetical protein [Selenomonadales bacterium 4137-cl]
MNVSTMIDELVVHIKKLTTTLQFTTPKGAHRAPQVVDGYLPPKDPKNHNTTEDFPYVIVRYLSDETDEEGATAQVKVICGVYSDDDRQGWRDLLNLMSSIKTFLLSNRLFGGCFSVELPLKREIPEEQPVPEWQGVLTLNVSIPSIMEVDEDVQKIFSR